MTVNNTIWPFVLSALALWRVTHLFAEENGPWDMLAHLRSRLGASFFGSLMDCFYCLSLWFSLPFAIWLTHGWIATLLHWLALSGAACLLERFTRGREERAYPIETFEGDIPCAVVTNEMH